MSKGEIKIGLKWSVQIRKRVQIRQSNYLFIELSTNVVFSLKQTMRKGQIIEHRQLTNKSAMVWRLSLFDFLFKTLHLITSAIDRFLSKVSRRRNTLPTNNLHSSNIFSSEAETIQSPIKESNSIIQTSKSLFSGNILDHFYPFHHLFSSQLFIIWKCLFFQKSFLKYIRKRSSIYLLMQFHLILVHLSFLLFYFS